MDIITISDSSSNDSSPKSQPLNPSIWEYRDSNNIPSRAKSSNSSLWMIQPCKNNKRKAVTVSYSPNSSSTEESSVSWDNKSKDKLSLTNDVDNIPSANTKVHSWLNNCNFAVLLDKNTNLLNVDAPLKRSILIRHDFKKDKGNSSNIISKPHLQKWKYNEKCKDNGNLNPIRHNKNINRSSNPSLELNTQNLIEYSRNDLQKETDELNDLATKHNQKLKDVPLSPESQKKNELCSYLQLMNMSTTGKKIINDSQQRRSTRVKNLAMLSEKRKLEQELHTESFGKPKLIENEAVLLHNRLEDTNECNNLCNVDARSSRSKSSTKLKKNGDNMKNLCIYTTESNDLPMFRLPNEILNIQCDFDVSMKEFMKIEDIRIPKTRKNVSMKQPILKRKKAAKWKSKKLKSNVFLRSHTNLVDLGSQIKQLRCTRERLLRRRKFRKYIKQNHQKTLDAKLKIKTKTKGPNESNKKIPLKQEHSAVDDVKCNKNGSLFAAGVNTNSNKLSDKSNDDLIKDKDENCLLKSASVDLKIEKKDNGNSCKEKQFNIIDLSHTVNLNECTLHDHSYTIKTQIDKNYIMNVILGENHDKQSNESKKSKVDDTKSTSSITENSTLNEIQSLEKSVLEDIIGVSWSCKYKASSKSDAKTNVNLKPNQKINFEDKKMSALMETDNVNVSNKKDSTSKSLNDNSLPTALENTNVDSPINIIISPETLDLKLKATVMPTRTVCDVVSKPSNDSKINYCSSQNIKKIEFVPKNVSPTTKSLHKNLINTRSQTRLKSFDYNSNDHTWDRESPTLLKEKERKSYSICISRSNGVIINACYIDYNLVIAQEQMVSFWMQSALGNMLSSQNMWISKGSVNRLTLDSNCNHQKSCDMVMSLENSLAYIELWTKEHKSDKRERPVADVFATVYFWRHRQNVPCKKVLQLENINGYASDVQYIVLRNSRNIIVSWNEMYDDKKKSVIHCYNLAADFQTVMYIKEIESVDHYISSLHNIEDCDNLIMGYGNYKMTFWNLEGSYIVSTIEINDIKSNPSTLWVKCDRGFLFALQHYETERLFKLIGINGINESWKRLQVFRPPYGYYGLRGVCVDNNILVAFYENGIICWNIQSGESVIEEISSEIKFMPSGKHVIMLTSDGVLVQHALSYCITNYDL